MSALKVLSGGIREPRQPNHLHSEQAISGGFSGMQQPPTTYFSKSKSDEGIPHKILRIDPLVPHAGHGAVLNVIFLSLLMETD